MIETIEAPTGNPVAPPERPMKRALSWNVFERRFQSLNRQDGSLIWEPSEVPDDADWRYWWTVLDPMTSGTLYVAPGFHFVNRLGYIRCAVPWGGEWERHPEYVY
ncbi:hypothetical protein [uncultured Hyphomicrobium sp.]|jgi:hypothetical protein|uniref:hypothetical protein n=1 Tax=uncultured Hyphomicrobium sp. TaxID=194373 RepID=UPI0025EB73E5|nr:hypothetical protein [uncultured Hyphomicrobium sp.]